MSAERLKQWKDILTRTGKTFVEAFLGYLTIDGFFGVSSVSAFKKVLLSLLVGAAAAGITAVWNMLIQWLTIRIDEIGEPMEEIGGEDFEKQVEEVISNVEDE